MGTCYYANDTVQSPEHEKRLALVSGFGKSKELRMHPFFGILGFLLCYGAFGPRGIPKFPETKSGLYICFGTE